MQAADMASRCARLPSIAHPSHRPTPSASACPAWAPCPGCAWGTTAAAGGTWSVWRWRTPPAAPPSSSPPPAGCQLAPCHVRCSSRATPQTQPACQCGTVWRPMWRAARVPPRLPAACALCCAALAARAQFGTWMLPGRRQGARLRPGLRPRMWGSWRGCASGWHRLPKVGSRSGLAAHEGLGRPALAQMTTEPNEPQCGPP